MLPTCFLPNPHLQSSWASATETTPVIVSSVEKHNVDFFPSCTNRVAHRQWQMGVRRLNAGTLHCFYGMHIARVPIRSARFSHLLWYRIQCNHVLIVLHCNHGVVYHMPRIITGEENAKLPGLRLNPLASGPQASSRNSTHIEVLRSL